MKKQNIPMKSGLKLSKKTIANLDATQLNLKVGGGRTNGKSCDAFCLTQNGFTCHDRRCV